MAETVSGQTHLQVGEMSGFCSAHRHHEPGCRQCEADAPERPTKINPEEWMRYWDGWRRYIAEGGKGSWPRDAFESLLEYIEEIEQYADWLEKR